MSSSSPLSPCTEKACSGGGGEAAPAAAVVVEAALEGAMAGGGCTRPASCDPSRAAFSHTSSPVLPWKARTLDCHATTTWLPEETTVGGGTSESGESTAAMWASHTSAPMIPHSRTYAPVGETDTETRPLPCVCSTATASPSGSTWRQAMLPSRRSMPATTPGSLATSAMRCGPDEWKCACFTTPTCCRYL